MSVFVMNDAVKMRLKELKEFAEKNPFSMDDLLDVYNKQKPPAGETGGYWCEVPVGYKVVFSVELQKYPIRHLSMSSARGVPSVMVVQEIMKELGFVSPLEDCYIYFEGQAVNVIEKIYDENP